MATHSSQNTTFTQGIPIWCAALFMGLVAIGCARQTSDTALDVSTDQSVSFDNQMVELSCGQCQLGMKGGGCSLAIRHGDETYFVADADIDDHGDAHADDGLCNCVRQARVTGTIKDGKLHATNIELIETAERSE